ncbi:MAG: hypothetical protein ACFFB0_05370 [Promethearchaeota archaeon]
MEIRTKKLLLIGIEQAIPYLINKFYQEDLIPNIGHLIENGVIVEAYPLAHLLQIPKSKNSHGKILQEFFYNN